MQKESCLPELAACLYMFGSIRSGFQELISHCMSVEDYTALSFEITGEAIGLTHSGCSACISVNAGKIFRHTKQLRVKERAFFLDYILGCSQSQKVSQGRKLKQLVTPLPQSEAETPGGEPYSLTLF